MIRDNRRIPYGMNGCLLNFAWGAERVTDYSALSQTKLMTRSPWALSLPPEAEKAYLSCAPRWQNEKGELGPWGEIQSVVVA